MHRRTNRLLVASALCALVVTAGAVGIVRSQPDAGSAAIAASPPAVANLAEQVARPNGASLERTIVDLESRVATTPGDDVSWATLALAYVQQARISVDPEFYPKAESALNRSFLANDADNFLGYAGRAALAAGLHDFSAAKDFATQGLTINPYSSLLHGLLGDAQTQLGDYEASFATVQKMVDLSPDTASLSRASYAWELRGETTRATELMQRAFDAAPTDADRAYTLHHLGQLAFDAGDPNKALEFELRALTASPDDPAAQFGRAIAETALGQTETALDHLAALTQRVPDPQYFMAYGTLLESVGRLDEAKLQYRYVAAAITLFAANGYQPDADAILFQIHTGDLDGAISNAETVVKSRPFISTHDAYAWALHAKGRDREALTQIEAALSLGTKSALFHFHAGMIHLAVGDTEAARRKLTQALAINPYFDPLAAPIAKQQLETLQPTV